MQSLSTYFRNPKKILIGLIRRTTKLWPDKLYLKLLYRLEIGRKLSLDNPKTFTEKIQWLKLYDRKPEYTSFVDKYAVKKIVGDIIGNEYIIPTLGVWNNVDDIDWDTLPNQFVLKTTHGGGGGGVVICSDKSKFNKEEAKKKLSRSLKSDISSLMREWPYKEVPRRTVAEKLLTSTYSSEIKDYKFFCFNGEPKFLKVDFGRFSEHHANYYDLDWNLLPYGETGLEPDFNHIEDCPPNFKSMINIAKKLSNGFTFLRVDLYNVDGKIYFGELTLYPASGLLPWTNINTDYELGTLMEL